MALTLGPNVLGARVTVNTAGVPSKLAMVAKSTDVAKRSLVGLGVAAKATAARMASLAASFGAMGGVGLALGLGAAVKTAADFSHSMARVNTMLEIGQDANKLYGAGVKRLAVQVGQSTDIIAEGLFQALSAGVEQKEVMGFLDVAAKAAVGGFTDLNVAVDGTTSVLNAYGLKSSEAKRVTDAMFAANKVGKTTFEELAGSIGNVAPTAAALGVQLEDVFAGIAAGTKVGLTTKQVARALRFAMASLAKPSKQAQDEAEKLGLRWDENSLKGKRFADWLVEVKQATNGSVASLSKLVGSSQAAGVMLALTSETGLKNFNSALTEMESGISLTDENAKRGLKSTSVTFKRFATQMSVIMGEIGESVLERFFPNDAEGGLAKMRAFGADMKDFVHTMLDLVEMAVKNAHALFALWLGNKVGKIISGLAAQLLALRAGGMAAAGAAGVAGAASGGAGALGKLASANLYITAAIITGVAAWKLGEAIYRQGQANDQKENTKTNRALGVAGFVDSLQSAGLVSRGAFGSKKGDMSDMGLLLSRLKGQFAAGSGGGRAWDFMSPTEQHDSLQRASAISGKSITNEAEYRTFQRVYSEAMEKAIGNVSRTRGARKGERYTQGGMTFDAKIDNPFGSKVAKGQGELAGEIREAFQLAIEAGGMQVEAAQQAQQAQDDFDTSVNTMLAMPDVLMSGFKVLETAATTIWDASVEIGNQTLEIAHKVIDGNKKRKHRGGARLTKRGAGAAKHLNPRYRLYTLRTGLGAAVIRPMPENYSNPAVINSGE